MQVNVSGEYREYIVILRKDAGIDDTKTSDTTRTSGDCLLLTRKDKW